MVDQLSESDFVNFIHDPLYGLIGITEKEKCVIQTQILQRLRGIKQLGIANFIYPGANHTRFEHSLGTMYITNLILDKFNIRPNPVRQNIRLAALFHDLGHGPFSHIFEELIRRNEKWAPIIDGKKVSDHDIMTLYLLRNNKELQGIIEKKNLEDIADFLENKKSINGVPGEIITGDIGSDRMDYLLRDTYYTGLGHRPDINSLISNLKIYKQEKKLPRIAVDKEGIISAEFLITTRYYHYTMIVHNPKVRSVEIMFLNLMKDFLQEKENPQKYISNAFTKFDDAIVQSDLYKFDGTLDKSLREAKFFNPIYNFYLGEIRSGVIAYCVYRFLFDCDVLLTYLNKKSSEINEATHRNDLILDASLWEHDIPDVIFYQKQYETKSEWISPFLADQSEILRLIPYEQLSKGFICVFSKESNYNESEVESLRNVIQSNRRIFLSIESLVPLTRESLKQNDFKLVDDFYTFICALRDFHDEKPWKEDIKEQDKETIFRGITRFFKIAYQCYKRIGKPNLKFKEFWTTKTQSFWYSSNGYSLLNAFGKMGWLKIEYIPVYEETYHRTYVITPLEMDIRKRIYEDLKEFNELRKKYLTIMRKLDWDKYFSKFFLRKAQK